MSLKREKIDPFERSKLERYVNNLSDDAKLHVIMELYFFSELGKKTVNTLMNEFDSMYTAHKE